MALAAQTVQQPPASVRPRPLTKAERLPLAFSPTRDIWTLPLHNQLTARPAFSKSQAFFAIEGDRIAAYDLLSGVRQWAVAAQPLVQLATGDDRLFFIDAHALTALRVSDGSAAWRVAIDEPIAVRPVWDGGWLILATSTGSILAFRASDGELIWRRDLGSPAHAAPALAGDRAYVPVSDGRVVALNVSTGAPVWERRLGGMPNEVLALDDRVYAGSEDNFFYCLMSKDGRVDWRWRTGGDIVGAPVADEHRVYFTSLDNVLRALDRTSGSQHWMKALPLRPAWGPVMTGPTIVVAGQVPTLRTFNAQDGVVGATLTTAADVATAPQTLVDPATGLPMLLVLTHDIAKGAVAQLLMRDVELALVPVAPLPNMITMAPPTATPRP